MDNFSQAGGLLQSANDANELAVEQMNRIQEQKDERVEEAQQAKDAFAQAGELLGGGLIEKSAENLIKKGVRLGRNKLKALGVNADEIESMAQDYSENGTSGLIAGVVKRGGLKTREQLNSFINNMKGKMEGGIPAKPSSNITTDDFGLPAVKADLPDAPPIVKSTLVKGGDDFRFSRVKDPAFETSKFRAKIDPSTGSVNIVNNETGNVASDAEISGYDANLLNRLKKVSGYEEPPDPLETASPSSVKQISARFDSYFNDGNEGAKPLSSDAFDFKAPPPPKPTPKPTENINRFGVGDEENLPSEFKSASYSDELKGVADYGKQISNAFMGAKFDENRFQQLKNRISDLKTRKSNLDSDSLRSIYKDKIEGQPKVKKVNGQFDLDSLEKNVNYRENAMDATEKFQGIARQEETSVASGFVKSPQELFDEQFPPVPKGGQEFSQEPQPVKEPEPVSDVTELKGIDDFGLPNVGSNTGTFNVPSIKITEPDISALKPPPVSNEVPTGTGGLGSDAGNIFSKVPDAPEFGSALKTLPTLTDLSGKGTSVQSLADLASNIGAKGDDIVSGAKTVVSTGSKGAEAASVAGETDLALGGPEDPVGDVISAVVGIGTLIGSLFGDKPKPLPKPPPPPQIRTTFQVGQDV